MDESVFLKCACGKCGGHIEFPASGKGLVVNCPHCGTQTTLTADSPGPPAVPAKKKSNVAVVGISIALVLTGGALAGAHLWRKPEKVAATPPQPTPQAQAELPKTTVEPVSNVQLETSQPQAEPTPDPRPSVLSTSEPPPKPRPPGNVIKDFEMGKIVLQKTPGSGLVYAVGTVTNSLDRQRFGVRIELNLLNEEKQNIGTASDYVQVIEPHKDWRFKALLTQSKAAKVTVADISEQQ